jgi:hypothetical protein
MIEENKQKNLHTKEERKKKLNNKITQTEENHKRNKTKKFFEGIQSYKQQVTLPTICKDAKDNVVSQPDLILER